MAREQVSTHIEVIEKPAPYLHPLKFTFEALA